MERTLGRGDLGPGQRQGDQQRGHGLDRPRRGHRLHRRARRVRRANSLHRVDGEFERQRGRLCGTSVADSALRGEGSARSRHPRADAPGQGAEDRLRPSCAGAPRRRPAIATAAIHHPHEIASSTNAARSASSACTAAPTPSPTPSRRWGSATATGSGSCAATTAASSRRPWPRPSSAPARST